MANNGIELVRDNPYQRRQILTDLQIRTERKREKMQGRDFKALLFKWASKKRKFKTEGNGFGGNLRIGVWKEGKT